MSKKAFQLAILTQAISATGNEVQLLPAGEFRARDGRPTDAPHWFLDKATAEALIAKAAARQTDLVLDYDHQTLRAEKNGQPAPAAGWFRQLEWRDGSGLWAVNVDWTTKAAAHIEAGEYRYISPVFLYDKDGRVQEILMAAITNNPALDGMDDVMLAAATRMVSLSTQPQDPESEMDEELLERLRWMLNLPVASTAADIKAQLEKLIGMIGADAAAASFDILTHLQSRDQSTQQQIAALTANQADPAKFVPVATMAALQAEIATLRAKVGSNEVEQLVSAALSDGRLLPAQEKWARDLAQANPSALREYLDSAPSIAALTTTQTQQTQVETPKPGQLDDTTLAVCSMFGNNPEEVQKHLQEH